MLKDQTPKPYHIMYIEQDLLSYCNLSLTHYPNLSVEYHAPIIVVHQILNELTHSFHPFKLILISNVRILLFTDCIHFQTHYLTQPPHSLYILPYLPLYSVVMISSIPILAILLFVMWHIISSIIREQEDDNYTILLLTLIL